MAGNASVAEKRSDYMLNQTVAYPHCGRIEAIKSCSKQGRLCAISFKFAAPASEKCPRL